MPTMEFDDPNEPTPTVIPKSLSWAMPAILLLALALRLPFAFESGLTGDEATYLAIGQCSPWQILSGQALDPSNPPLSMLLFHFLMKALPGDVELLKLATSLINVVSIIVIADVVRLWLGSPTALWAALLLAINPWHVFFATELRGYALAGLFAAIALNCAIRFDTSRRALWGLLWAIAVAAGFWTHYSVVVVGMVSGFLILYRVRDRRGSAVVWCLCGILAVGLMAIWLPQMRVQQIASGGQPEHLMHLMAWPMIQTLGTTYIRPRMPLNLTLILALLALAAFAWPGLRGLAGIWKNHRFVAVFVIALLAASVLIPVARSARIGSLQFSSRYTFVVSPVFVLLVAVGLRSLPGTQKAIAFFLILVTSGYSLGQFKFVYGGRSMWENMTRRLAENVKADDAILLPNLANAVRLRVNTGERYPNCFVASAAGDMAGFCPTSMNYVEVSRYLRDPDLFYTPMSLDQLRQHRVVWYWLVNRAVEAPHVLSDGYALEATVDINSGKVFGAEEHVVVARFVRDDAASSK